MRNTLGPTIIGGFVRKLSALLVALLGLFVLVESLQLLYSPISVGLMDLPVGTKALAAALSLLPAIATLAIGVYLMVARERIVLWYLPGSDDALSISAESLLRAGLVLLGVYLVAQALPEFVKSAGYPLADWLQLRADQVYGQPDFATFALTSSLIRNVPAVLSALVSLGFGLFLLAKRESIVARVFQIAPVPAQIDDPLPAHCPNCGAGYDPSDYDSRFGDSRCASCREPLDIPRT